MNVFLLLSQPLMDNLESQTYEVFEKDPIKYSQYQQVRTQMLMLIKPQQTISLTCGFLDWKNVFLVMESI